MRRSQPFHPLLAGSIVTVLGGCVHSLHEVHVSDVSPDITLNSSQIVSSQSEQWTFLGFVSDTTYVDQARLELLEKCPRGRIEGITTQYLTNLSFMSWTNTILMKGYCVPAHKIGIGT